MMNKNVMLSQLAPYESWGHLLLRLVLGVVFLVHGSIKLFEVGVSNVGGFMASLGVPASSFFGVVVSAVEFFGGIFLILGLLTRWTGLLLAVDMLFAILLVHGKNGFLIGEAVGYEFVFTLLGGSLALFFMGAGKLSLDAKLSGKKKSKKRK